MLFHTEQSLDGQLHSSVLASADMRRTGHPRTVHIDVAGAVIAQCLEDDRRWSLAHTMTTVHKTYEKTCICVRLLQSGCHMHLLNNNNGITMTCIHLERYQN